MKTLTFALLLLTSLPLAGCVANPAAVDSAPMQEKVPASPAPSGIELLRFYAQREVAP